MADDMDGKLTVEELRDLLNSRVSEFGSQRSYAEYLGVSTSFLSQVLKGRKNPNGRMFEDLGYSKQVIYVQRQSDQ